MQLSIAQLAPSLVGFNLEIEAMQLLLVLLALPSLLLLTRLRGRSTLRSADRRCRPRLAARPPRCAHPRRPRGGQRRSPHVPAVPRPPLHSCALRALDRHPSPPPPTRP
ncbi:hypothetical protein [Streptomyces sp. NBC_01764]